MSSMITVAKTTPVEKSGLLVASVMMMVIGMAGVERAEAAEMEKCYGVAKAGMNDCATNTSSCAGTSKTDRQGDAYIALPKGACEKIAGGSLTPKS